MNWIKLLAAAALACALPAQAQRVWLLPASATVDYKAPWVTVDAAQSEHLFIADRSPLKLDSLVITGPQGQRVTPASAFTGQLRSGFDIPLESTGTYKASLLLRSVAVSYLLDGKPQRWRGPEESMLQAMPAAATDVQVSRLQQRVETFVSLSTPDRAALTTTGEGLELQPISHPNDLRSGEVARFRLLLDGQPAALLPFSLIPGGVRYRGVLGELRYTTDAQGEVAITLPPAGMLLLSASWPAPSGQSASMAEGMGARLPPRRLAYSATLEVLPP